MILHLHRLGLVLHFHDKPKPATRPKPAERMPVTDGIADQRARYPRSLGRWKCTARVSGTPFGRVI